MGVGQEHMFLLFFFLAFNFCRKCDLYPETEENVRDQEVPPALAAPSQPPCDSSNSAHGPGPHVSPPGSISFCPTDTVAELVSTSSQPCPDQREATSTQRKPPGSSFPISSLVRNCRDGRAQFSRSVPSVGKGELFRCEATKVWLLVPSGGRTKSDERWMKPECAQEEASSCPAPGLLWHCLALGCC